MLFNSLEYLLFFPTVTLLYYLVPLRARWWTLLAASAIFYMAFVPLYIVIILGTIGVDYVAGIIIDGSAGRRRKFFLVASLAANIGALALFKYWRFAAENANAISMLVGSSLR